MNAIAAARKAFVHTETSAKVRKALKHPVRQYCDVVFKPNDNIFYKLPTDRRWQGPVMVSGIDDKVILIKHGSVLRRIHPGHLRFVPSHELIDMNPVYSVNLHHPSDIECSVPTTDNNTDITDANTTASDRNIDDFDEFVPIQTTNDNTNDSVTVNHTNQNDSVPVRHTSQNVQVVLPKENQASSSLSPPWTKSMGDCHRLRMCWF